MICAFLPMFAALLSFLIIGGIAIALFPPPSTHITQMTEDH
jgi:hypothetical protein